MAPLLLLQGVWPLFVVLCSRDNNSSAYYNTCRLSLMCKYTHSKYYICVHLVIQHQWLVHNKTSTVPSQPSQQTVVHKWIHTRSEVTWFNASAAQTHTPFTSFLLITSPNASIFGLPLTAVIMSQTVINASGVHFLLKHKCNFWFCRVGFLALVMSLSSPSSMMLLCRRSPTTASASTSLTNRSQNWSRTSLAEWRGQNHATPTRQYFCSL